MADRRYLFGDLAVRVRSTISQSTGTPRKMVVLVHGIGTSHRYFARLHDELARTADVYSIDLPGFGGLPKPAVSPSVSEMSWVLAAALDRVGIAGAVLVGHSMGAQWVVELGAIRPDLTSAVVVIGPVSDDRHRSLPAQAAGLVRDIVGETPSTNATVFLDYLRCGPVWFLRQSRPMLSYPIEDRVALLDAPLLVLRGGNDPIAAVDWCRRLAGRASAGSVVTVPGHRHVVQFTAPRAVASAIEIFAESHR